MSNAEMARPITQTASGRTVGLITTSHCLPVTRCCGSSRKGAEVARGNQARHVIRDTNGTILEINSVGSGWCPHPSPIKTVRRACRVGVTSLADVPHAAAARGRGELRASDTTLYPRPRWIR